MLVPLVATTVARTSSSVAKRVPVVTPNALAPTSTVPPGTVTLSASSAPSTRSVVMPSAAMRARSSSTRTSRSGTAQTSARRTPGTASSLRSSRSASRSRVFSVASVATSATCAMLTLLVRTRSTSRRTSSLGRSGRMRSTSRITSPYFSSVSTPARKSMRTVITPARAVVTTSSTSSSSRSASSMGSPTSCSRSRGLAPGCTPTTMYVGIGKLGSSERGIAENAFAPSATIRAKPTSVICGLRTASSAIFMVHPAARCSRRPLGARPCVRTLRPR